MTRGTHALVRAVVLTAALLTMAAACGDDAGRPDATGTVPVVSVGPGDDSIPPAPAVTPEVQAAVADLATRQGVPVDQVDVVEVREVTWRDGSLGCPQPGVNYTQALVSGQLVVLAIGEQRFEYHSGPRRPLFFCADPRPPLEEGAGSGAGST
jgi:hypothetical protein